ncbi:MAG: isoleucine--tRNA ligase [Firmicutes bacterium]|nr:isoleucine--tRNA ligase [Bacillota bacterium]
MYEKLDPTLNFAQREEKIIEFWEKNRIFEKSIENRASGKEFTFYDGPPTANGKPHIGHILTRVYKDIIPRFQTMKGKHVLRKAGWDTHGLPVELEVEKTLGFDGKGDIEKYGVEPFIKKCRESVWKYKAEWERISARVGFWADMEHPYVTYEDDYIESVWWALSEIYNKGLMYKGHKVVPYCPRCGTALSSHEVSQGYKDVTEESCVVKFGVRGSGFGIRDKEDNELSAYEPRVPNPEPRTYILAWTTTPWTLPSNVAVCFHPEHEYSLIESNNDRFILAKELIEKHFKPDEYTVLETKKGKAYEGLSYEPLFNYSRTPNPESRTTKQQHYVTTDTFVTLSDGTGVVHIAPAFGEDDANIGRKYDLPFLQLVGTDGKFVAEATDFAGMFCKDADKHILKNLAERGLLFSKAPYAHSYPFCWRCHTPLLYYARSTWFIRMTAVRENLIKNNDSVHWIPDNVRIGRMGNFIENVIDWGVSRERYWGTPLPLWICDKCGKIDAVGSKAELLERAGLEYDTLGRNQSRTPNFEPRIPNPESRTPTIELHKPYVDAVTFTCSSPSCTGSMRRTPEVIDCWFDSGSMPFAQLHYMGEEGSTQKAREAFKTNFPADFISEAVDQTRGWFYTLLAISTLLFGKSPFKNCLVLGHVNDEKGRKMSKHLGNVVDPWTVLDKQGADAVRWYFYTAGAPHLPSRFYEAAVSEAQRKFLGTLWNVCSFYALYAEIDKFNPAQYDLKKCELSLMDRWVLSELNSLAGFVDKSLEEYKITESARKIEEFVDALSNWYVRRCRDRYWAKGMEADKIAAYMTLFTVLETLSRIIAPFVPFISESIWQIFVRPFFSDRAESVHLADFPKPDKKRIDTKLEEEMCVVLSAAALGRAARNGAALKNRQPLSKMYLAGEDVKELSAALTEVLRDELNVKAVEFITDAGGFIDYEVKPQLKTLGPKYGKLLLGIREHLQQFGRAIVESVNAGRTYAFTLDGQSVQLSADDLLINVKSKEGFASESAGGLAVILDTVLTEELIEEGLMREIISKIQTMRKDAGFEVTDRIRILYGYDDRFEDENSSFAGEATLYQELIDSDPVFRVMFRAFGRISDVTLADEMRLVPRFAAGQEWDINGRSVWLGVERVSQDDS